MTVYYGTTGALYETDPRTARKGGGGTFCRATNDPKVGVKIWHDRTTAAHEADRCRCLMRWVPKPANTMLPIDIVSEVLGGPPVGCVFPFAEGELLGVILNPAARTAANIIYSHRDCIGVGANTAGGMAGNHAVGLLEKDVHQGNRIVGSQKVNGRYPVYGIDTDSRAFRAMVGGRLVEFDCHVGQAEFLPPEVSGKDLRLTRRGKSSDVFGLAILVWMLIKQGSHPFAWRHLKGGSVPGLDEIIRSGGWPFAPQKPLPIDVTPVDVGIRFRDLPPTIQSLFTRAFRDGHTDPSKRPSAQEWAEALTAWEQQTPQTNTATADARSYLSALWRIIAGRAGLGVVSRFVAKFITPSKKASPPVPVRHTRKRVWLQVSALLLVLVAATAGTICGVWYFAGLPSGREVGVPPKALEPAGNRGLRHLPPDDLFDGVPLWDELHREVNAERRNVP